MYEHLLPCAVAGAASSATLVSGLRAAIAMRSAGQVLAVRLLDRHMWACQNDIANKVFLQLQIFFGLIVTAMHQQCGLCTEQHIDAYSERSGIANVEAGRVQRFQKPSFSLFATQGPSGPPTATGPCALHALHTILQRHCLNGRFSEHQTSVSHGEHLPLCLASALLK